MRVAFIDRGPRSGFMDLELAALDQRFDVERIEYPGRITAAYVARCLRAALRCDAVHVFFASEHALIPAALFRMSGKRVVLVQGGYDYANLPEHDYGLTTRGLGWLPKTIGRLCSVSLAISDQSRWEFLAVVPSAAPRTYLSPLAVDPEQWPDPGVRRDPDRVVTFGFIDREAYGRKGIDRFVAAARRDPDREYVLAGRVTEDVSALIRKDRPSNLRMVGYQSHDELTRLLWSSGVYVQLSWHETFGVAMAEAMLCGCVPVVSTSPALGEVAGRWAVRSERPAGDLEAISAAGVLARTVDRDAMREDVATRFAFDRRVRALEAAVVGVAGGPI